MNKHYYRLVFNKAKGRLVVVSEAATAERHGSKVTPRRRLRRLDTRRCFALGILRPLTWSILLSLGLVSLPAHAQIAPDRSAPGSQRPHVVNSANGTPQVNITSPNSKGVSRNTYRQFDVNDKGAILNNARSATSTQIGGWVQGNPNLANGEARVIVNEVNSSNPSRLHGAVEVAGRRAEVVIANPAGIDVDGAGFINAQGITLTTGQPQFNSGALDSYRVEGGTVRIHGGGFDAGDADYAAILARAAEVKAGVWAEEIDVVAGANRISADRQTINTIDGHGKSPSVGIDVAHLGGMYAGKIHLMATERGVGVNHAGDMVAGELVVEADGRITNRGQIAAQDDMQLASRDDIANHGSLRAGDEIVVTSDGELANRDSGTIIARNDIQLSADNLTSDSDSLLAAGVSDDGALSATGDLTMSASQGIEGSGRHIAAGGFYAQAETVQLRNSHTQARDINIAAGEAGIDATSATLSAQEALSTRTSGKLRTDGASVVADTLNLDVGSLSNIGGDIAQLAEQSLALRLDAFDNTSGRLASNSGIDIAAHALDNTAGALQAVDGITINASSFNNHDGDIVAGDALAVETSGEIDNTKGQWRAERIDVAASGLDNTTGLISATSDNLHVRADWFDNTKGRSETAGDLSLDIAHTLTNEAGEIIHAGQGVSRIAATYIEGRDGQVASQGRLVLRGEDIALDGATTSAESLSLHAKNLSHRQGEMQQFGDANDLSLNVGQALDNTGGLIAGNAGLDIAAQELINTVGILQAVDDISLSAGELNNYDGDIVAGDALAVEASGEIDNTQGQWRAERIDVAASGLDNTAGLISANGGELNARVVELDNTQGRLETAGDLSLDIAHKLTNEAGEIVHAGQGVSRIDATYIDGRDGQVASQGRLVLRGEDIALDGATTSAESLSLHAENLSHHQGEMQQFGDAEDLTLGIGQSFDNSGGLIASNTGLDIDAGSINNQDGTLQAIDGLRLDTGDMDNRRGEFVTGGQLGVIASGSVDNRDGDLIGEQGISVRTVSLDNRSGMLGTLQGQLAVKAGTLDNSQGRMETAGDLSLDIAGTVTNQDGEIVHAGEGEAQIDASHIDGSDGLISSQGELTLTADSISLDGAITSAERIAIQAERLSHHQGEMSQHGDDTELLLDIREELNNSEGLMVSHGDLAIDTGDLVNRSGVVQAADGLSIESGELDNRQGEILAGGSLGLDANGRLDNTAGRVVASRDATILATSLVNAEGTLATQEGDLVLDIVGAINNRQGRLDAGGELTSVSRAIDNRDGEIVATRGDIDTQDRSLDNRSGLIAAREALQLASGAFDNAGGTLQAGGDLSLDTHGQALRNSGDGTILGEGDVSLTVGNLANTSGLIGAGTSLDLQADTIINRNGGALLSEAGMKATAASLDNHGGQLQAQGDLSLDLDTTLGNQSGLIRAGQMLEVSANQVINQHTQGNGKGIEAHSIHLKTDELDNRQGAIRTDTLADLQIEKGLNNRNGLISSLDTLVIKASDIDNGDGTLVADRALDLTTARLAGDGSVLSMGDLALQLASDFTLAEEGELMAAGDLQLATTGSINNRGKLRAGDTLSIEATRLNNAVSGELSGSTTDIDTAHLTNRGLIDGVKTYIAADVLDNLGTGRIYGDWLAIEAGTLTNDNEEGKAAVMAARERLDLGIDRLINHDDALIFSSGDMAIGGSLNASDRARGQADRVENASATIEALGNLNLSTARLDNTNEHFETELIRVADLPEGKYIQPVGWDEKLLIDEFEWVSTSSNYNKSGSYRHKESGLTFSRWTEYNIERAQYDSQVVRSKPGQLLAGGNLHLAGGDLVNDKSRIVAGGMVHGDLNNLSNIEAVGQRTFDETGTSRESSTYTRMECSNGKNCGPVRVTYRRYSDWEPYSGQSSEAIIVPITEVREGNTFSGSGVQLDAHNGASLDASAQGAHGAQVKLQPSSADGSVIEVPALYPPTPYAESSLSLGDWAMSEWGDFEGLAATPADIEKLTAILEGMEGGSSASAIARTAVERLATDLAPLGMIRSVTPDINLPTNSLFQINPAPKSHYLVETDPRFTNQREWLGSDYMLDSLNHKPSTTHKRLGDGFYEQRMINEQIMQLTGQRYLTGYGNDDDQYRALMNAGVTFAEEHGLRPGVALTAEQMAQLTSDIVWLVEQEVAQEDGSITKVLVPQVYARVREGDLQGDGTLLAGNSLALDVKNDIVNTGALSGRELVDMSADNLTNLEGRISGNRVDLRSRRDLINLGGDITANESMSLQAGRDLNLASTSERLAGLYVTKAGGSLSAAAGRDLNVRGADLDSAGDLQLGAGRDLDIASTMSREQRWGGVSERSELERGASLSAGSDLILNAGRDLTLTAVDVSAGGDGLLSAGRDLALETLTPQESLKTWRNTHQESEEVGTELDVDGSLALLAGQDLHARASQFKAGDDLALSAGRDISLEAGYSQQYEETRQGGTHTIDSQSRVQSTTLDASGDLLLQAGNDLALTATQLQAGQEAALMAGGDIDLLTAQEQDYSFYEKKSSGGLFGGSRTQRDEVNKTRSIGSEVNSGGDLLVASGLDQTYQAARLESGGDIELRSGGNIRFETASDVHTEAHERSKSSFAWQSSSGEGFTRETLRQSELVAQGELIIQAADGLQIDVEQVDRRSVTRTIDAMVAANPDLAWLQEMEERGDIDWRRVKAIHDSWDYEQSGLGGGAAMVVAIAAAATGQYYALAAMGGTSAGAVAAAASAAAGSFAGTGAVSLINNRGDLGATFSDTFSSDGLRGAAIAAVTAGVTRGVMGDTTNTASGATRLDLSKTGDIARFAGQRATQAAIDAGVRTAIDGGSLSDNLEDSFEGALAHVASGVLFNAVGNVSEDRFANGSPEKIALHALTGGMVAEAMGGDFRTGALAAGANEALVDHLAELVDNDPELLVAASQVVGVIAAEMTNGDVNQGAEIAAQGTRYNYLRHDQLAMAREELAGCDGDSDCMADVVARYQAISEEQNEAAIEACSTDLAACQEHSLAAANGEYARYGDDALWDLSNEALPYMQALFDENIGVQNQFGEATIARSLMEGAGIAPEVAAGLAAVPWGVNRKATNTAYFGGAQPRNIEEAQFLANAQATFANSSTWTGVARHRDELVIQRSDIELSPQNVTAMKSGYAPRVRNSNGEWEQIQLHHVGRATGKMIEVTKSQNAYSPTTGGPLHIPGPGAPVRQRDYTSTYWKERYQEFVRQGLIVE